MRDPRGDINKSYESYPIWVARNLCLKMSQSRGNAFTLALRLVYTYITYSDKELEVGMTHLNPDSKPSIKMAHDLGAIRNALGILSEDRKKVRPKVFSSVTRLGPTETANRLHVSRPSAYKEEVTVSKKLMEHIVQLVMATDLAFELLNESHEETMKWLMSPNSILSGDLPFVVCMRGDGQALIDWLNVRLGRAPGEAF